MAASATATIGGTGLHPHAPSPYRVRERRVESSDVVTITLVPATDRPVPGFVPGQFNMVYAFAVGEAAISLSGDPAAPGELVHTVRKVGKVTEALVSAQPGEVLGVRGPYGRGWPVEQAIAHDVVIIAGGVGLPPLRPVLYHLLAHRDQVGRIEVVYGARSPSDLVYYPELQRWRSRPDLRFQVTVDAAGREWYGDVGLVTQRIPDMRFDPARSVAFLCGPEIMMRLSAEALEARGIPANRIFLSMERNMKCAIAQCGHCQFGPDFVCRDGPVFPYQHLRPYLRLREV
jgi:NAD(P)H-flavin reductase